MSVVLDGIYYSRELIKEYCTEYTGFYLALLFSFAVIVICGRKNKGIHSYVLYVITLLVFLLFPWLSEYFCEVYLGEKLDLDTFMIFPTILVTLIGFIILGRYFAKDIKDDKKRKRMWIGFVVSMFVLVLVEASVPLQLTFKNFTLPSYKGSYSREVERISQVVGEDSVIMPSKLEKSVTGYNWNTYFPIEHNTDYNKDNAANEMAISFDTGRKNSITYVIIKRTNELGKTNEETISSIATKYGYTLVDTIGDYLVYRLG